MARHADNARKEILAQEHVLEAIAVKVSDQCGEGWCPLRFERQRDRIKVIATIDERHVIERACFDMPRRRHRTAEHRFDRRIRVRREIVDATDHVFHGESHTRVTIERRESMHTGILSTQ